MAGREPVAMMMRSKLRDSSAALARVIRSVVEFSNEARPWMYSTLRCFESYAEAAGELLDHAFFPRAQAGDVDLRVGEVDAPIFGVAGFVDQLGDVE